jgi:hypothetical protein
MCSCSSARSVHASFESSGWLVRQRASRKPAPSGGLRARELEITSWRRRHVHDSKRAPILHRTFTSKPTRSRSMRCDPQCDATERGNRYNTRTQQMRLRSVRGTLDNRPAGAHKGRAGVRSFEHRPSVTLWGPGESEYQVAGPRFLYPSFDFDHAVELVKRAARARPHTLVEPLPTPRVTGVARPRASDAAAVPRHWQMAARGGRPRLTLQVADSATI